MCNDSKASMVPLTPAEPPEFSAFETIVRLSLSQKQRDLPNNTHTQTASNTPMVTNNNIGNTPATNIAKPHDQSTVILQQFNMITEESKNFTNKVSSENCKDHTGI